MKFEALLEANRMAQETGQQHPVRRELFSSLAEDQGRHFVGIRGPRGAGKTVLLQQLASSMDDACYVSLDTLAKDADLFGLLRDLRDRYGFRRFFLDEIHFLTDASGALKRIYDGLGVRVWS